MNTPIEEQLQEQMPRKLTDTERNVLWQGIATRIQSAPVPSPYLQHFFITTKTMIPLIVALAVLLSAGGTVAASDDARPGDVLYPLDRAIEDFKLSVAKGQEKDELRIKFASERLHEFDSIADDELGDDTLSGTLTEAEAHIFTNETIVKLEVGDKKVVFATDADTREEVIAEILTRYENLTSEAVDAVLTVQTEDRESTPGDGTNVSENAKLRLEHAFTVLSSFVADTAVNASSSPEVLKALEVIQARLLQRSDEFPSELRVRVKDDKARFETRGEHGKIRVELKDGEVRIKQEGEDEDEDRDDSRGEHATSTPSLEIEAKIFSDTTVVKVERNDTKTVFETDADTEEELIDVIQEKYPSLTKEYIASALRIETENKASDDGIESEDDEHEDNSSGSGKDDEEEEDNSGHGGGDD